MLVSTSPYEPGRPHKTADQRAASALDAAALVGPYRQLHAVSRVEFAHQAGQVGLDGADAEVELVCDLLVRSSAGDEDQKLLFAARERFSRLGRRPSVVGVGEGGEEPRGDVGCDQRVAGGGG